MSPRRAVAVVASLLICLTSAAPAGAATPSATASATPATRPPTRAVATFAGGCFWCMEGPFESLPGVISVLSGYTGGTRQNPSYEEVSAGTTGHAEAVQVLYDPGRVGYDRLLDTYWHNVDPLDASGQFCDHGSQYRPAIFVHDAAQRQAAERSLQQLVASGRLRGKVVVPIVAASTFYPAEDYHQDFYKKNPVRYQSYRSGCGRDRRLRELWGDQAGGH